VYPQYEFFGSTYSSYTTLYTGAFVIGILVVYFRYPGSRTQRTKAALLGVAVVLGGILGSRLIWAGFVGYRITSISDAFAYHRGSAWHPGLVSGLLVFVIGARLGKLPMLKWLDTAVFATASGQVLGRLGCFLSGDSCHGVYTEMPWGMTFPNGVSPVNVPVHPAHLYEAILLLALAVILVGRRPVGINSAIYLCAASAIRFILEFIRFNPMAVAGLTYPQLVSLSTAVVGGALYLHLRTSNRRKGLSGSP